MTLKKVQLNKIVKNQLPEYVREDFPLVGEFLSAYYKGQEYQGGPIDLVNNIDSYIKLSENGNIIKSTTLLLGLRRLLLIFLLKIQMDFQKITD